MDNNGNYSYVLQPDQSFTLPVTVINADELTAFGEPFVSPNNATFTDVTSATDKLFSWQPTIARCSPYSIVFRGKSPELEKDITVLIYVRDQNMEFCDTICNAVLFVETIEENNMLSVYPNPATDNIIINSELKNKNANLKIINALGQIVFNSTFDIQHSIPDSYRVDISFLPNGLYHLVLEDDQGIIHAEKFVVMR